MAAHAAASPAGSAWRITGAGILASVACPRDEALRRRPPPPRRPGGVPRARAGLVTRLAVITGASSGIGEAAARRLGRERDLRLVLVARREESLRALAAELPGATVIAADLT